MSELPNSENVAILPTPSEYIEIMKSNSDSWRSQREEGGHFDSDGNVHRWDRGPRYEAGATQIRISIDAFVIDKEPVANRSSASLYWHVHPKIYFSPKAILGNAIPSRSDKDFDIAMRKEGYRGTTLLVGVADDAITFYYGDTSIETIPIKVLNKLLKKDKQK